MSQKHWEEDWEDAVEAALTKGTIGKVSKKEKPEEPPEPVRVRKFRLEKGDILDQYIDSRTPR